MTKSLKKNRKELNGINMKTRVQTNFKLLFLSIVFFGLVGCVAAKNKASMEKPLPPNVGSNKYAEKRQ